MVSKIHTEHEDSDAELSIDSLNCGVSPSVDQLFHGSTNVVIIGLEVAVGNIPSKMFHVLVLEESRVPIQVDQ